MELIENHWLHIRLDTLLPHCRYQTPDYLSDTISRLLDMFEAPRTGTSVFPACPALWSTSTAASTAAVFLIRTTKAGRLFPTRSRVGLSRMTTSTVSGGAAFRQPSGQCLPHHADGFQEASDFFALRSEPYAMDSMYQGF